MNRVMTCHNVEIIRKWTHREQSEHRADLKRNISNIRANAFFRNHVRLSLLIEIGIRHTIQNYPVSRIWPMPQLVCYISYNCTTVDGEIQLKNK